MPLYSMTCPHGHFHDYIVPTDTVSAPCKECEAIAIRLEQEVPAMRNPAYGIQS